MDANISRLPGRIHFLSAVVAVLMAQAGSGCGEGRRSSSFLPGDLPAASAMSTATTGSRVFVTSALYPGNLGGLAGGDAKCQALAIAAGLDGTYKAWLSDDTTTASARLAHSSGPYVLVDGTVVASDWSQLTSGFLSNAIAKTETNGTPASAGSACNGGPGPLVWTGTNSDGTQSGVPPYYIQNCAGWSANGSIALVGLASEANGHWSNYCSFQSCNSQLAALYCVQQPCHYFTGTATPATAPPGGTVTLSGTLKNCAPTQQSLSFAATAAFSGASAGSCASSMAAGRSFPVTLAADFSASISFPLTIPADACPGAYTLSVTTYTSGGLVAVDHAAATLTVQP